MAESGDQAPGAGDTGEAVWVCRGDALAERGQAQVFEFKRLGKKIGNATLHRLLQIFHRSKASHDNDRNRWILIAGNMRQVEPAHGWHFDVGQQQIKMLVAAQQARRLVRIAGGHHFIATPLKGA